MAERATKAHFAEPMLLVRTERLPEGAAWQDEVKLDGYRALALKSGGHVLGRRHLQQVNCRGAEVTKISGQLVNTLENSDGDFGHPDLTNSAALRPVML